MKDGANNTLTSNGETIIQAPVVSISGASIPNGFYFKYAKRLLDVIIAVLMLLVLSLPLIIIAILIKLDSAGPVVFKQLRYGRNKKPFTIYKFRTMSIKAPSEMATNEFTESNNYITKVGKILRKLSLDELPQLINIIIGDMSFVGPRPVILKEKSLIDERDKYGANILLPGVTGWAQVNGRDELNDILKSRLDGEYVANYGLRMDMKCIFFTFLAVISTKGYSEGYDFNAKIVDKTLDSHLTVGER